MKKLYKVLRVAKEEGEPRVSAVAALPLREIYFDIENGARKVPRGMAFSTSKRAIQWASVMALRFQNSKFEIWEVSADPDSLLNVSYIYDLPDFADPKAAVDLIPWHKVKRNFDKLTISHSHPLAPIKSWMLGPVIAQVKPAPYGSMTANGLVVKRPVIGVEKREHGYMVAYGILLSGGKEGPYELREIRVPEEHRILMKVTDFWIHHKIP